MSKNNIAGEERHLSYTTSASHHQHIDVFVLRRVAWTQSHLPSSCSTDAQSAALNSFPKNTRRKPQRNGEGGVLRPAPPSSPRPAQTKGGAASSAALHTKRRAMHLAQRRQAGHDRSTEATDSCPSADGT